MKKNLPNLVKQLDRKRVSESLAFEFVKMGQPAFDYLYEAIEKRKLSTQQTQHAFNLLFNLAREPCFGEQNRLLHLALAWTSSKESDLRGTATVIAVRLTELGEHFPQLQITGWTTVAPIIQSALDQGLPELSRSYVQSVLTRYGIDRRQSGQSWKNLGMENKYRSQNFLQQPGSLKTTFLESSRSPI